MRGGVFFAIALAMLQPLVARAQVEPEPPASAPPPQVQAVAPEPPQRPSVPAAPAPGPRRPTVAAIVEACVPVDAAEFHRVLSLELGADVAYLAGDATAVGATRVEVGCVDEGIELRLEDPVTRKSMARVLSLDPLAGRSRTRLLALAVAEFVVASWIELSIQPAPSVEPVAPAPSAEEERAVAEIVRERHAAPPPEALPAPRDDGWQLSGAFTGQLWSSHDALVLGGTLRLLRHSLEHFAWTLSADFGIARVDTVDGRISLTSIGASGVLLLHLRGRGGALYAGPGARAGIARLEGLADVEGVSGTSFFAPLVGPIGYGRAEVSLWSPLRAAVEIEIGLATMPTRAQSGDTTVFELDGAWFTGSIGLGAVF